MHLFFTAGSEMGQRGMVNAVVFRVLIYVTHILLAFPHLIGSSISLCLAAIQTPCLLAPVEIGRVSPPHPFCFLHLEKASLAVFGDTGHHSHTCGRASTTILTTFFFTDVDLKAPRRLVLESLGIFYEKRTNPYVQAGN